MSRRVQWSLKEIRSAYVEAVSAYNEIYPIHPPERISVEGIEEMGEEVLKGDECLVETFRKKAREITPKLKEAADQSGNAISWHCGQSLDGLNQGMKERIEKALRFGI